MMFNYFRTFRLVPLERDFLQILANFSPIRFGCFSETPAWCLFPSHSPSLGRVRDLRQLDGPQVPVA